MIEIVGPLSVALVHFLWQGCAIALMLALALRLTRGASADLRYALSVTALGLMLLMPVAGVAVTLGADAARPSTRIVWPAEDSTPGPGIAMNNAPSAQPGGVAIDRALRSEQLRVGIVAVWLIGVLAFTGVNTGGWLQIRRLRRSGVPVEDPAWDPWIARLRDRLGMKRVVSVLSSARVDVPTLLGWVRPVILIPTSALVGMNPRALEALLLHELAHVRRHDFLVNLLQAAVETLLFYHPAVWWVSRTVRCEREHCCDDLAVSLCGSRQVYVQALTDMERLRLATPRMAVAADGGLLVNRIRRLIGSTTGRNGGSTRWTMGIGIIALALAIGAVQLVAMPSANARPVLDTDSTASALPLAPAASGEVDLSGEEIEGTWRARGRRGDMRLELRLDGGRDHQGSFSVEGAEFTGTGEDGIPGFLLVRDAGTFDFEGRLDGNDRESRFVFRPNPEYVSRMGAIGFEAPTSARRLFGLALLDVSLEFAEGIRDADYGDISISRLTEFRIHGVTPRFIEAMAEVGLEELSPSRLTAFRIHGVTPEFVREMAELGLDELSPSRLVEFRIHGVTPEFVNAMQEIGLEDLGPSRLVEFRIHGVSADFVNELAEVGLHDIPARRLVEMRIHGVGPDFVRKAQSRHGDTLTVQELIEMRIHGRD